MESTEQDLSAREFVSILLWMPNWIGDAILALPTIDSLRKRFPQSRITVVSRAPADELLRGMPLIDSVITSPPRKAGFWSQVQFARGLKKYNFDLAVTFPNSFRSAFLLSLTGAKTRLGHETGARSMFLTHGVETTSAQTRSQYRVDYFFNALAPLKLEGPGKGLPEVGKLNGDASVDEALSRLGVRAGDFFALIHPGSSKPERGWHHERFTILCQKLIKERNIKIVLLGNEQERPMLEQIRKFSPDEMVSILPKLNLREVALVMARCGVFVGNDSGMMHLAAMMRRPVTAIFGPGSSDTTGPYMDRNELEVISLNFPCSPCRQRFFTECKPSSNRKPFCLENISVKEVAEGLNRLLNRLDQP
ncbi:MAG: lipopolysaccharide heptosyltransferase II [Candidatus Nitrohelix vancouverensis]|uniref:lipopolysaccharide heptosyltransferase II n=1 Tax=Candidatus Nitrohelix vancouverensis TaxID=2705534 RepID=A0A7T0C1J2_9BACT|nr:MAG: lipopolysaccharide heptosyltransferase II [Candidatus Nitrohelix vancouverensis]